MSVTSLPTATDHLDRARSIAPLVRREAEAAERQGEMTGRVFDALAETGLFWMLVPEEFGGGGQGVVSFLDTIEEISCADASTGWSLMANAGSAASAAGFLSAGGVETLFGGAQKAITAGQLGPSGTGHEVPGGFRFSGRYQFGSGALHSTWIGAGFTVVEDGRPRKAADGSVEMQVAFVPRPDVEMAGNWQVSGLCGTGSVDYVVHDQFVPRDLTFERLSVTPRRGEPVYALGNIGVGLAGHCGVALGLMKRALAEVVAITHGKKRVGYPGPVGDHHLFLHEFARNEALYQAARSYVFGTFGSAEAAAGQGGISEERRARIRQVSTWVHDVAAEVVEFCRHWGGTQAFRQPSALDRVARDMAVARQHVLVDPVTMGNTAPVIVESWRAADADARSTAGTS